ncbi:MAG TPA: spore coat U domain-containing protein [Allosphingosinicella sp.]|nr:spore coat U domain-containing protein [Allosphingosinicella sp.]
MLTNLSPRARASGYLLAACAVALAPSAASAAVANSTLSVDATVTANCTVSAGSVSFGSVNPISGSNADATGSFSVTCTNGTSWSAAAGVGSGSGASFTARRMTSGANTLNYNLYTSSGYGTVWGDGTSSTAAITGTGTGSAQSTSVYGRIGSGQTSVPPGSYADTVSVTVTY